MMSRLWLTAVLVAISGVASATDEITLGMYGPLTSVEIQFGYVAAAALLDFRKHYDPDVRARFGEPIVKIADLDPRLGANVRLIIGNSNSETSTGVTTGKDFCLGIPGEYNAVNGIVGGYHSAISMPIASLAAVLKTVQVSWGSTSPALSNKAQYPYFSRTIPPDSVQGKAFIGFMKFFGFRAATYLYSDDGAYGSGMYEAVKGFAVANGEGDSIVANPIAYMPQGFWDDDIADTAVKRAMDVGNRLIMVTFGGANNLNFLPVVIANGMVAPDFVLLFSESAMALKDLTGVEGIMSWAPVSKGPKYPEFADMWSKLKPSDISDHLDALGINTWSPNTWDDKAVPAGKSLDTYFTLENGMALELESPFIFDAFSTFIVAMNNMLKDGHAVADLKHEALLEAVRNVNFEGISGTVMYDAAGDRLADYNMMNGQGSKWMRVGGYSAATDKITVETPLPIWGPGFAASVMPPDEFVKCHPGTFLNVDNKCQECAPGFYSTEFDAAACDRDACKPGTFLSADTATCEKCATGYYSTKSDAAACDVCKAGTATNAQNDACVDCTAGTFSDSDGKSECATCGGLAGGYISTASRATTCDRCPAGKTSSESREQCVDCAVGKITAEGGLGFCANCSAGTYAPSEGLSKCLNCGIGRFQTRLGTTECVACGGANAGSGLYTTMQKADSGGKMVWVNTPGSVTEADCGCKATSLEDDGAIMKDGACVTCPEGLRCDGMGDFGLKQTFWSSVTEPQSVYKCENKERCPGGEPGDACGPNLPSTNRACSACIDEWVWDGESCKKCESIETTMFLFPILPIILGPCVVVFLYKLFGDTYEKWGSPANGLASIFFIVLNHYQIIAILRGAAVNLPISVSNMWDGLAFTSDVASLFNPQCAGNTSFESRLIWKTLGPLLVAIIFAGTWGVSQLVSKVASNLKMEPNRTINGFFSLMFTFFAGIVEMAFVIFKCGPNPNDTRTLIADRSVVCFESGEWQGMLVIGILAVLFWCVGFGALFTRTVIVAPGWFHDKDAQMRWKFLFIKYRSDVHWWSLVIIFKGIMLNLGFLFLDTGVSQIYWVMACLIAYTSGAAGARPWRHMLVNVTDIWSHLCLILVASLMTWFASKELEDRADLDDDMSNMIIAGTVLCIAGVIPPILQFAAKARNPVDFIKSNMIVIQQFHQACLTVSAAEKIEYEKRMSQLTEWDLWFVKQTKDILMTELMAQKSRSGLTTSTSSLEGKTSGGDDNKKADDEAILLRRVVV